MICSSCKNPNKSNSQICEWCSTPLAQPPMQKNTIIDANPDNEAPIELFIKWESFGLYKWKFNILVDNEIIGSGKANESSEFSCITNNHRPEINFDLLPLFNVFNLSPKREKVNLKDNVYLLPGNSYLITIGLSHGFWKATFISKSIVKLNSNTSN
jgi:hypothetical protein